MQVCIYSNVDPHHWSREFFPAIHPLGLPVAGKGVCSHLIDFCTYFKPAGVSDVLIIDCNYSEEMALSLGDGNYWVLNLDYQPGEVFSSPGQLLEHYKTRFDGDDLLLFWGAVLPDIKSHEQFLDNLRPVADPMASQPDGVYLYVGGTLFQWSCPLHRMDTLKSYYELNFKVLREPGLYILPGYSSESGYGIGRNVNLKCAAEVERPVMLGDGIYLEHGVQIRGGTIVGQDVWIDENTELVHSIVLDHTYLGRNLLIENKIVSGNRIIDPEQNVFVELEDDFLAEDTREGKAECHVEENTCGYRLGEVVIAFCLGVLEFPLYLLALISPKRHKTQPLIEFLLAGYPKIWKVVIGRAQLVCCFPGVDYVFRYSDLWPMLETERQKRLDDLHFRHHRSLPLAFAVAVGSQIKRLFVNAGNFAEQKEPEKSNRS